MSQRKFRELLNINFHQERLQNPTNLKFFVNYYDAISVQPPTIHKLAETKRFLITKLSFLLKLLSNLDCIFVITLGVALRTTFGAARIECWAWRSSRCLMFGAVIIVVIFFVDTVIVIVVVAAVEVT